MFIGISFCLIGKIAPAHAETTAQFDVTATIAPGCLVDGLGDSGNAGRIGQLDFGVASTFSNETRNASTNPEQGMRIRCTPGVNITVNVDGGGHADAGVRHLQRAGGDLTARLAYAVCRDPACGQPIPIGGGFASAVTGANSEDVRIPIYGVVTLPGTLPPGDYSDTLTLTLTW